jgi:periplasmic protein TonB
MNQSTTLAAPAGLQRAESEQAGWKRFIPVVVIVAVLALAGWGASQWLGKGGSKTAGRQTVKIAVLPDAPPPPPPPVKEEKKPEPPKEEPKQAMQEDQPKPVPAPPAPQQLNMEGPAGNGPSAFGGGSVTNDYQGGQIGGGGGASAPAPAFDRAKYGLYAKSAVQMLRSELDRSLPREVIKLGARLRVWVDSTGHITRYEVGGLNDQEAEDRVRAALDQAGKVFKLVPPSGMPQPIKLQLSVDALNG